jgi:hypothetical protein
MTPEEFYREMCCLCEALEFSEEEMETLVLLFRERLKNRGNSFLVDIG